MIFIASHLIGECLKTFGECGLDNTLNFKRFTVSNTPLSYRKVNSLDSDNLLGTKRENTLGWRKFSYKELVYFEIIFELKKFGVKQDKLRDLYESFFKEPSTDKKQPDLISKNDSEMAITLVFRGVEITLVFYADGKMFFCDNPHLIRIESSSPQIRMSLNKIVNHLHKQLDFDQIRTVQNYGNYIFENFSLTTSKEKEILNLIRNNEYSSIEIKKKDGEVLMVHVEHVISKKININEIMKIINLKKYATILITKRDGKIVNHKLKEAIKL
jgi:hypothetical protein